MDGGPGTQDGLLTGVEGPCARLEGVAPQRQVNATAKYIKATCEVQKVTGLGRGFQRQGLSTHEEEEGELDDPQEGGQGKNW